MALVLLRILEACLRRDEVTDGLFGRIAALLLPRGGLLVVPGQTPDVPVDLDAMTALLARHPAFVFLAQCWI